MKGKLENDVKHYVDTFAKWIAMSDRAHPLRALIDIDSQNMLPRADAIIMSANGAAKRHGRGAHVSQRHTRDGIVAVGIAMAALGLGFSWLIGLSITRPLHGLGRRDEAAGRRRHFEAYSRHHSPRRDRRYGAHCDRVPRHHDRA